MPNTFFLNVETFLKKLEAGNGLNLREYTMVLQRIYNYESLSSTMRPQRIYVCGSSSSTMRLQRIYDYGASKGHILCFIR